MKSAISKLKNSPIELTADETENKDQRSGNLKTTVRY